jgi:hypothetical protein
MNLYLKSFLIVAVTLQPATAAEVVQRDGAFYVVPLTDFFHMRKKMQQEGLLRQTLVVEPTHRTESPPAPQLPPPTAEPKPAAPPVEADFESYRRIHITIEGVK